MPTVLGEGIGANYVDGAPADCSVKHSITSSVRHEIESIDGTAEPQLVVTPHSQSCPSLSHMAAKRALPVPANSCDMVR